MFQERKTLIQKKAMSSIQQKILSIQNEIQRLSKDEVNKFQHYKYFTETQVLEKVKPLLNKYKLLITISDEKQELTFEKPTLISQSSMAKDYSVKYLKKVEIWDIEAEEKENKQLTYYFWAVGNSNDIAKAKGAAETYALKYFLSKFFLVPVSESLDPDQT